MRTKVIILSLVAVTILLLIYFYPGQKSNQPLKVYVIFQEDEARILLEKYKKKTGQSYELIRMSGGEASYHLMSINKTGIDVVLGGPADLHEQLKNKGKLIRYSSHVADEIPDIYKDKMGYWTGIYMGALAIGVNEQVWNQDPQLVALPLRNATKTYYVPSSRGKLKFRTQKPQVQDTHC